MAKSKASAATNAASPPAQPEAAGYTVVARRYRPQQFAELIGQEHVAGALVNALQSGRVAHAYLFTGARGVGKTSAARILAKALNCESSPKPTPTPCDKCASCLAIAAGDDVDVLEIDGASNNKVEEVRDLRQGVGFRPTRGRYKIYIIDEVHMLSTSAFNALLKTLEEPPEHVKFILATTEVQKIPITILSRCQRFDFAHVGPAKIFEQLRRIAEREGHEADDDALRLISRRAAGSMRDSQSILDQLLASASGKLTAEHVAAILGTAGDDRVIELASAILRGDAKAALDLIAAWVDRGLQVGELVDQLVEYWRAMMLVSCGGPDVRELPVTPNQHEALKKHAQSVSLDAILGGLEVLTATKGRMRGSTHTQVLLEMAVVRLCRLGELLTVGQLVQALSQPGATVPVAAANGSTSGAPRVTAAAPEGAKKNDLTVFKPVPNGTPATSISVGESMIPLTESTLNEVRDRFLRYMQEKFPILANHLRFTSSYATFGPNSPNTLAIRFPPGYNLHQDACGNEAGLQRIQESLRRVTGQAVQVRVEVDPQAKAPEQAGAAPVAVLAQAGDRKKHLQALPLFKKASQALGAQIWHVDDEFNPVAPPRVDPDEKDEGPEPEEG
jgi:DNA polymerase-3 subunit gamma/tau